MGILFFIITLAMVVWGHNKPLQKSLGWLALYMVCAMLHFLFKGYRWPYLLIYIVPVLFILDVYFSKFKKPLKTILKIIWLLPAIGFLLLILFPKVQLQGPKGPYNVGTFAMNFKDETREEIYDEKKDYREIRVQIFYPTKDNAQNYAPWILDGEASVKVFAKSYGLPAFAFSHLIGVESHSLLDVEVADDGPFPVVILSHGWKSTRIIHQNLSEMLASHGYIVFAIDHTYVAAMTRTDEGETVGYENSVLPKTDFLDEGEIMIDVFSKDVNLTRNRIDFLQEMHPILKGAMNLDQVALIGHSTGGAGVVKYAGDYDAQAVIGLDAWVEPITNIKPLNMPSLFIRSQAWLEAPNNENLKKVTSSVYDLKGSKHQDFTLAGYLSPALKWFGQSGENSLEIQEEMILHYLDSTLKGLERDLNFERFDKINLTSLLE